METLRGITIMNINQTLNGLSKYIASQGGVPHLNRFAVEITNPKSLSNVSNSIGEQYNHVLQNLTFSARAVGLPSKTLSTNAVMAAGPEQKYPYMDNYDDLNVTFMSTKGKKGFGLPERKFFEDWLSTIVSDGNMLVGFSDVYSTDLRVSILSDQRGSPSRLVQYAFERAYPIAISAIEFAAASHDIAFFKVTFSYDKYYRVNVVENTPNPASVLPEPKNGEIPERKNRIWTSEVSGKYKHPVGVEHAKQASRDLERPDRIKKPEPPKPKTPERPNRVEKWEADWKQSPIENKRVVGGKANTPTPKKLTKAILGRVANRARAELGIRPMLDE